MRSVRQSTSAAPGMWPAAWTAGALPSGRQRRSRTRTPGRPRFSASHSVVARISGRARPLIARYHTAVVAPFLPDPEKLAAVREAHPGAVGRDLPEHRVGRAAAGRDGRGDGRDRDLRARRRARPPRLLRRDRWPGWTRRGPASRPSSARTSRAVALTHSTTDGDERRDAAARLARRRPGGDDGPRARRRRSGRCTRCATGSASTSTFVDAGDDGDDDRTLAAFDAAITPGHAARLDLARAVDDRSRHAGRARSPRSPTTAAPSSSSTAPRPPARSRSVSTTSAPTCTPSPAQKWLLGPEGMGALVVDPAHRSSGCTPALGG